ncbi:hypothetical protein [Lewinella sp. IMCC34183]|uniref:hypothetical protein n=1 Tax=Lewinella sp. IMCC34183 TaxID=2248762 RepID=UPI000E24C010|nr:hypothetical protein [Lewinella sp. IMCC34183]
MRLTFLVLLFSLLFSCGSDPELPPEAAAELEGRWELTDARRNNVKTTNLDGLYFDFRPNGELLTNLMGEEQQGTYTRNDTELVTEGVAPAMTYEIESLEAGELVLRSELQGFYFVLRMRKADAEES